MNENFEPTNQEPSNQGPSEQAVNATEQPMGNQFDPMTGKPTQNQYDPLATPAKKSNGAVKIVLGIVIALFAVIIITIVVCIKNGVFLSTPDKIALAAKNTFEPTQMMEDMNASAFIADGNYTLAFEGNASDADETVEFKLSYQQDASKKCQALNGKVGVDGTNFDVHEYLDEEQLMVSIPKLYPDVFYYSLTENKDGYIREIVTARELDAFDHLLSCYVNNLDVTDGISTEYAKVLREDVNDLTFENVPKRKFKVDGKVKKCKGYTTTVTEDDLNKWIDDMSAVYDEYNEDIAEDMSVLTSGDESDPFDDMREAVDGMYDMDVTFYLYKNRIVAIEAVNESDDSILVEFRGGDYAWQNTVLTCKNDYGETAVIKLLGKTEDSVEKMKLAMEYDGDKEVLGTLEYDTKTGDLTISSDEVDIDLTVEKTAKDLVISLKEFDVEDLTFSGSITVKHGSNIKKPEGDIFDIGTASEDDFYELIYDIDEFSKEIDW